MGNQVYVIRCGEYAQAEDGLRQAVASMGGMGQFVRPGERILLKVNLLRPNPPESAVCTHPAVVTAIARMVAEAGATAVIADSPGGALQREGALRSVYEKTGMAAAAAASGAQLGLDPSARLVDLPQGRVLRQAEIISPALDCDGIFDLCKMKTHVFMGMTGAVKNSFGLIPGLTKVGFHGSHPDKEQFAQVLLDLIGFMSPRLTVMDAVLAMEGEGPGASGTPRQVGLLLLADNPLALDVIAGEIMGLPRARNALLLAAEARGLSPTRWEDVQLVGARLEELRIPDYQFPTNVRGNLMEFLGPLTGPAGRLCKNLLSQTPRIRTDQCVGCGICKNSCPGKAIEMTGKGGTAKVDPRRCIRCYCCHELCPQKAVALHRSWLGRLLSGSAN